MSHQGNYSDDDSYDDAYDHGGYMDGGYDGPGIAVPKEIIEFLQYFQEMIREGNIEMISNLYENGFPKFTEAYYKDSAWPDEKVVRQYVGDDEVFISLYNELNYRHIYSRLGESGVSIEHRFESYYNYCTLFNYIISAEDPVDLELPNQWLWDIIDEFIFQFQSFIQYRCKVDSLRPNDKAAFEKIPKAWNVHSILNVLHSLVEKSNINQQLKVYNNKGNPDQVAGKFGQHPLYKMLGYFSLVGLLRLHSLLGDYYNAIKVLENIELNKKSLYSRVPGCQITTYYYVGFAYLMMRRYADAIRTFSNILLYVHRTKQMFQAKSYQNDLINRQTDRMYSLLAICLVLHPQRIDEYIHQTLKDKLSESMSKMQKGDMDEFKRQFTIACPKFLNPLPPNYDNVQAGSDYHKEPLKLQLKVFLEEVQQQKMLPTIRSYLKLYTTMSIEKMAGFMDMPVEEFRTHLLAFKHKMQNVVWTKGTSGLVGEFQSGSELDFYIDKDMIHIADTKVARRYGDFFIRQIHKFDEVNRNLKNIQL